MMSFEGSILLILKTEIAVPPEVIQKFEGVLKKKELQKAISKLTLVMRGKSLLDGKKYYAFQIDEQISQDAWSPVWDLIRERFVFFEGMDNLQGWMTSEPGTVSELLGGIQINSGL
jgi:hypothetical protein